MRRRPYEQFTQPATVGESFSEHCRVPSLKVDRSSFTGCRTALASQKAHWNERKNFFPMWPQGHCTRKSLKPCRPMQVNSLDPVAVLSNVHDAPVTAVAWCPDCSSRDLKARGHLRLASADEAGEVAVWDVARAQPVARCILSSPSSGAYWTTTTRHFADAC